MESRISEGGTRRVARNFQRVFFALVAVATFLPLTATAFDNSYRDSGGQEISDRCRYKTTIYVREYTKSDGRIVRERDVSVPPRADYGSWTSMNAYRDTCVEEETIYESKYERVRPKRYQFSLHHLLKQ